MCRSLHKILMDFEINDRIADFIDFTRVTKAQFARDIDISPSRLGNILAKRNNPDAELLTKIAKKFRTLNLDWLFTGEGSITKEPPIVIAAPTNQISEDNILLNKIIELAAENGVLKEENKSLRKQLGYTSQNLAAEG